MLDEMTNPSIIDYILDNEDSTETECEMASRLIGAMEEIDRLVAERNKMLCELHQKIEALNGDSRIGG